ncbi:MAG: hypothetical protein K0S28_948, partial [Paucimonas sp.]|nr:hypothetical protein [Paucimonas sp.]
MRFQKPVIKLHVTISLIFVLLTLPVLVTFVVVNYRANMALSEKYTEQFIRSAVSDTVDATTRLFNPMLTTVRTAATLMRDQPDYFRKSYSADYLYEIVAQNEAIYAAYVSFSDGSFRQVNRRVKNSSALGEPLPAQARFISRYIDATGGKG